VALQLAAELRETGRITFPDGVIFVSLASVTDPALVDAAIAVALGLHDRGDRAALDQLHSALRTRRMLLILDNAEHVVAAAPHLVALLSGARGLRLLVTSRTVLHVAGEHVFVVPPLALPASDAGGSPAVVTAPAVQLFLDRARAAAPSQAWTAADITAIVEVCRQLDGVPLAIELAAARSRILSPHALLTHLCAGPFEKPARRC